MAQSQRKRIYNVKYMSWHLGVRSSLRTAGIEKILERLGVKEDTGQWPLVVGRGKGSFRTRFPPSNLFICSPLPEHDLSPPQSAFLSSNPHFGPETLAGVSAHVSPKSRRRKIKKKKRETWALPTTGVVVKIPFLRGLFLF